MVEKGNITNCFFHADLDAFFAAVEQHDNPALKGKPVIVGGLPGERRTVVSTASYEARKFGVHSAMPIVEAYRRCPQGVYLHGRHQRYAEVSHQIMTIFHDFSPEVQQMSIDEAFLDMTRTRHLFGEPPQLAALIKDKVREVTGLTLSIGVASNKYLAKIASGMQKPDGLFIIPPGGEADFMGTLPVEKIWGAGSKTQELFRQHSLKTGADIRNLDMDFLERIFGKALSAFLYKAVRGEAAEDFDRDPKSHSISAERTFEYDLYDPLIIEAEIRNMSETLMWRLFEGNVRGRMIFLKIRYGDFSTESIQTSLDIPVQSSKEISETALALFNKKYRHGQGIRLLGVGIGTIEDADKPHQGELFLSPEQEKLRKLEKTVFNINKRFPGAVHRQTEA
ncbi:MAG: DNA polymerase IV [Spirochaetaceae bacterium]|nr:DNA polymerase IV [Spirochaetaceae bacterium]